MGQGHLFQKCSVLFHQQVAVITLLVNVKKSWSLLAFFPHTSIIMNMKILISSISEIPVNNVNKYSLQSLQHP